MNFVLVVVLLYLAYKWLTADQGKNDGAPGGKFMDSENQFREEMRRARMPGADIGDLAWEDGGAPPVDVGSDEADLAAKFPDITYHKVVIQVDEQSEFLGQASTELRTFLEANYPQLLGGGVITRPYPPPPQAVTFASIAGTVQIGAVMMFIMGHRLSGGQNPLYKLLRENKFMAGMCVLGLNLMASTLTATGAFEISLDGKPLFSRLDDHNIPSGQDIVDALHEKGIYPKKRKAKFNVSQNVAPVDVM